MPTPLDKINDGYEFQRIVAEYFRCLKREKHDYQLSNIKVEDFGVGPDNGCDILIDFFFEDPIEEHKTRWIVECKSQTKAVGGRDINIDNVQTLLDANDANGYLLVCKSDATSSVKQRFRALNSKGNKSFRVWNGTQLWYEISQREPILEAFFPSYYKALFIDKENKKAFNLAYEKLEKEVAEFNRKKVS